LRIFLPDQKDALLQRVPRAPQEVQLVQFVGTPGSGKTGMVLEDGDSITGGFLDDEPVPQQVCT
jgi:hypothetical protein